MPLSTVCVSTVSSRPRTWSSYSNIRAKDDNKTMNSTEEISVYKQNYHNNPSINHHPIGYSYDFPEKSPKKDKKWSIGSLFRRKKKEGSEGSSEEDQKKGFLGRRRRKPDSKRKKQPKGLPFDHVVIPPRNQKDDPGILSDPTGGFSNYIGRALPKPPETNGYTHNNIIISRESLNDSHVSLGSSDSLVKKNRRDLAKARAEARRTTLKHDSSSEEDSQCSAASLQIRSEENLRQSHRDSFMSRRSRAARTERYMKRHSKDGENPHNYLRLSKSDVENTTLNWKLSDDSNSKSPSRSPLLPTGRSKLSYSSLNSQTSSISGLSTIPPASQAKFRVSNSTSNPSYKPPLSMNDYNNSVRNNKGLLYDNFNNQRSISCDANIHRAPSSELQQPHHHHHQDIMHVQFPLTKPRERFRNLSLIDARQVRNARQPPPPPPRDPSRLVTAHYLEGTRPSTYYFEPAGVRSKSFNVGLTKSNPSRFRSTSQDHLQNHVQNVQMVLRPTQEFNYLADKKPRSRKPIFIDNTRAKPELPLDTSTTKKAVDFWRQIDRDQEKAQRMRKSGSHSPQMFTCKTHVENQVFLPSCLNNPQNKNENDNPPAVENLPSKPVNNPDDSKRKSSNLEDALDELEAIFNSLGLGDEDLLERAEQREKDAAARKLMEGKPEMYPGSAGQVSRGALSDSSFSYEPFDGRTKRHSRKSSTFDRKSDDMACRKFNKRATTISDPQTMSNVSYLLASPFHDLDDEPDGGPKGQEPDIMFDDVVYKKLKHANNSLKVAEPQPPFGIPLGPITPAANSDYLHAVPEKFVGVPYKQRTIPDIVKDDLAFRNLRKDGNKEPALPQLSAEDFKNNNGEVDLGFLKKRRAVRSLSANIGSLINKEIIEKARSKKLASANNNNEFKTLTDIADAMEIARQVLKEKESNITATRKAFLSDTDTKTNAKSLKESRMNFLNGLNDGKPPRASKSPMKEPPKQPESSDSSLDDLLNALAEEAKETTERITNELKLLSDKDKEKKESLDRKLSEIDEVSTHAKLCEKLLECVVDSRDLMASVEEVEQVQAEPVESRANIVLDVPPPRDSTSSPSSSSEPDYENLVSDKELKEVKPLSPFEEHKAELIASFQELKANMDELEVTTKAKHESVYDNLDKGETCVGVLVALPDELELASPTNPSTCDHQLDSLESLKSPRLVLETEKLGRNSSSRAGIDWHVDRSDDGDARHNPRKPTCDWYRDPTTMAIACSYGVACAVQMASLDLVTILGIVLAIVSFIAALLN